MSLYNTTDLVKLEYKQNKMKPTPQRCQPFKRNCKTAGCYKKQNEKLKPTSIQISGMRTTPPSDFT